MPGNTINADGYYGEVAWSFADSARAPRISYRYADFDGDDPDTAKDERFREIAYGYTVYCSWFLAEALPPVVASVMQPSELRLICGSRT